jgi:hypothetical protein
LVRMRRVLSRVAWMCVCVFVWPNYYAAWVIEWMVSPLALLDYDLPIYHRLRSPPFLDRVR